MLWSSLQNGRSETCQTAGMQSQSLESQRIAESVLTAMSRLRCYDAQVEHYTEFIQKNLEWEFAGIYADDGISAPTPKT